MTNKIANWDNLTEEQKNTALKLLEGQAGMNPAVVHPAAKFFEKNHWVKIDKFIDQNMANLLYHHVQLEAKRLTGVTIIGFKTPSGEYLINPDYEIEVVAQSKLSKIDKIYFAV